VACGQGAICSGNECLDPHDPIDEFIISNGGFEAGSPGDSGGGEEASADASLDQSSSGSVDSPPDVSFTPNTASGAIGFTPTNFSLVGLDAGPMGDAGIFTGAPDEVDNVTNGVVSTTIAQNDINQTPADLYVLHSLTIDPTASLTIGGSRPVILLVLTTVNIQGAVYVTAGSFGGDVYAGPGAPPATYQGTAYPDSTDFGGSYCGVGGKSGAALPNEPGGATYGNASISPLQGGSGSGCNCAGGGGAVQIVAGSSIVIGANGFISAGGGGGAGVNGGGGSGGAILLEAPSVVIRGSVAANGSGGRGTMPGSSGGTRDQPAPGGVGGGGNGSAGASINGTDALTVANGTGPAGGGGAGWIRINTAPGGLDVTDAGIVSPSMAPATSCATQGALTQ
jgi:hypothetical protein